MDRSEFDDIVIDLNMSIPGRPRGWPGSARVALLASHTVSVGLSCEVLECPDDCLAAVP
jgi:hypothetical protein